jgi:hypothetical protein
MNSPYIFFIEYFSGERVEIGFNTQKFAEKAYLLYSKEAEKHAKSWGYEKNWNFSEENNTPDF